MELLPELVNAERNMCREVSSSRLVACGVTQADCAIELLISRRGYPTYQILTNGSCRA